MKIKIDDLDKLFSRYIRLLSGGYCKRCHKHFGEARLQTAHFHSRRKHSTRWFKDNVTALCCGCHRYLDSEPLIKVEFFMELLGKEDFDKLNKRAEQLFPKVDKEALKVELKGLIKEMEGGL